MYFRPDVPQIFYAQINTTITATCVPLQNAPFDPQLWQRLIYIARQHSASGCSSQNGSEVSDSGEAIGSCLWGVAPANLAQHLVPVEHRLALLLNLLLPALLCSLHPLQHRVPPGLAAVHLWTHLLRSTGRQREHCN